MIMRYSLLLALGSVLPLVCMCEDAPVVPAKLALRQAFSLALANNKDIRAARLGAEAGEARVESAKGAFDPTLEATTSWEERDDALGTDPESSQRSDRGVFSLAVSKRFTTGTEIELKGNQDYTDDHGAPVGMDPLSDSLGAIILRQDLLRNAGRSSNWKDILIAGNEWNRSLEGVRGTLIVNLLQVEQAYWNLYYSQADLAVRNEQLARANQLVKVGEAQVRVGQAAPIEIIRARSSAASQAVSILDAENRISLFKNRLLRYLGVLDARSLSSTFSLADDPPPPDGKLTLERSLNIACEKRPDVRQALLDTDTARLREDYARNQRLPALQVYGGVGVDGADDHAAGSLRDAGSAQDTTWEVGVVLKMPLGNRTAKGDHRAAILERKRAHAKRRHIVEQAMNEVADAYDQMVTARKRITSATESVEHARALLEAEEKSFKLGRSTSLDVLDAQAALASAEREVIRARVSHAIAHSYLLSVRGDFIEAKRIPLP
ncbi:MAG: TolC family protein [Lentisphaeria bacterium]|nr:TolC family protein [Lentisphaeria bacterium]